LPGKINRAVFRYIEHELYNYDNTKEELEALRDTIIEQVPAMKEDQEKVTGGELSKPTERKGVKLLTNKLVVRMSQTVEAIDRALDRLGEEHYAIFELKYRRCKDWKEIIHEAAMSERAYFYKRKELVEMVALQMGLLSEE